MVRSPVRLLFTEHFFLSTYQTLPHLLCLVEFNISKPQIRHHLEKTLTPAASPLLLLPPSVGLGGVFLLRALKEPGSCHWTSYQTVSTSPWLSLPDFSKGWGTGLCMPRDIVRPERYVECLLKNKQDKQTDSKRESGMGQQPGTGSSSVAAGQQGLRGLALG